MLRIVYPEQHLLGLGRSGSYHDSCTLGNCKLNGEIVTSHRETTWKRGSLDTCLVFPWAQLHIIRRSWGRRGNWIIGCWNGIFISETCSVFCEGRGVNAELGLFYGIVKGHWKRARRVIRVAVEVHCRRRMDRSMETELALLKSLNNDFVELSSWWCRSYWWIRMSFIVLFRQRNSTRNDLWLLHEFGDLIILFNMGQ